MMDRPITEQAEWLALERDWWDRQHGEPERRRWSDLMSARLRDLRRVFGYKYRKETNGQS